MAHEIRPINPARINQDMFVRGKRTPREREAGLIAALGWCDVQRSIRKNYLSDHVGVEFGEPKRAVLPRRDKVAERAAGTGCWVIVPAVVMLPISKLQLNVSMGVRMADT